jgi:hypothetical protein
MPYQPKFATKSITVKAVTLTLDPLPNAAAVGQTIIFSGFLTTDGVGWGPGQTIDIYAGMKKIASGMTQANGYYEVTWTIPFKVDTYVFPCASHTFQAYHAASGTWSNARSMQVAFPVRIRDFWAPDTVRAGDLFTAKGFLEFQDVDGAWKGIGGATVNIYYDGNLIGPATTQSNGYFEKPDCKIPTVGTYTLKADYAGTIKTAAVTAVAGVLGEGASALLAVAPFALLALAVAREHGWLRI